MREVAQSPTDPAFVADPYPFYARARAAGPVVFWRDYGMPVATTHAAVAAVLKDRRFGRVPLEPRATPPRLAAFAAVEAHSLLNLEPPAHTRLRGLVLRAFTSRRVAALGPEIEALAHRLIDALPDGGCDLLPAFAERLPVIVIARLLGVPEDRAPDLLAWSHAMVAMYQAGRGLATEHAAAAAAGAFAACIAEHIAARRAAPEDDLLSQLAHAEADGARLTDAEITGTAILLLNAGHEATVHTIGNGVQALLGTGTLGAEPERAAEEILRFDPPLHLFTRYAYADAEIEDTPIARGTEVGCLLASAGRDPAAHPDPDRFDPSRPPRPHLAFGAGIHFCLGAPLARLELAAALRVLAARLPMLALAAPAAWADTYHFRGLDRLDVRY